MSFLVLRICQVFLGSYLLDELNSACSVFYALAQVLKKLRASFHFLKSHSQRDFTICIMTSTICWASQFISSSNLLYSSGNICTIWYSSHGRLQMWSGWAPTSLFSGHAEFEDTLVAVVLASALRLRRWQQKSSKVRFIVAVIPQSVFAVYIAFCFRVQR